MIEKTEAIAVIIEGTPDMMRSIEIERDGAMVYIFERVEEEDRPCQTTVIAIPRVQAETVAHAILLAVRT